MKVTRKIVEIDEALCNGCGQCVAACAEGAIKLIDGKARLVSDTYCDGLGACIGECPTGALRIVEREAESFDEAAVAAAQEEPKAVVAAPSGCPSAYAQLLTRTGMSPASERRQASALGHWPVQIRLVPPHASFLDGADLLVAADCVPVACPNFHTDFLDGRVVMLGCPKFDDAQAYVDRFAEIFRTADVKSVIVVVMQVPCCQSLPLIVQRGMAQAGASVPIEKVVVSLAGETIARQSLNGTSGRA